LRGFLENVDRFQAQGWAFDEALPDNHVVVEIQLDGSLLGTVTANRYRPDLEQACVGRGDHSFVFNFAQPIAAEHLEKVSARVVQEQNNFALSRALSGAERQRKASTQSSQLSFPDQARDDTHNPVFVLGSVRSGTSAVGQALISVTRYRGYGEGHLLDLLADFLEVLDKFYDVKRSHWDNDRQSSTLIRQVPIGFFQDGINNLFVQVARSVFPQCHWVDKTPTMKMVRIAPALRQIWPNSKFIFMKRRAFENLMSRARKFADRDFARNCAEWAEVLRIWSTIKEQLRGCTLELDQYFMAQHPDRAAAGIAELLGLDMGETGRLAETLGRDYPERTSEVFSQVCDPSQLGWSAEQWKIFAEMCGNELAAYGYSRSESYYASDDPGLRMQRI
jgi:hypothetical protein